MERTQADAAMSNGSRLARGRRRMRKECYKTEKEKRIGSRTPSSESGEREKKEGDREKTSEIHLGSERDAPDTAIFDLAGNGRKEKKGKVSRLKNLPE